MEEINHIKKYLINASDILMKEMLQQELSLKIYLNILLKISKFLCTSLISYIY